MIAFSCLKCGKHYNLKPEFAGRTTKCAGCKEPLVVPTASPVADAPGSPKIEFSCDKCGMKFSVPAECAGRKTTCPACKAALVVPAAEQADVPRAGQIAGMPSILARAGVDVNVTLGDGGNAQQTPLHELLTGKANADERYLIESELARGGMGAIMRALDCDIRREVAVKYLLDQTDAKKKVRFIEEAQITGQLEHPNIVPIHEIGVDAQNHIFFSMKMVKGRSLADILKSIRGEPEAQARESASLARASGSDVGTEFSQGRLLNVFVNICNALAYAHSRGVVHRDLKPANIMVGDFGEVYVMDWGLAKVLDQGVISPTPVMAIPVASFAAPAGPFEFTPAVPLATPVSAAESQAPASTKVMTSREQDADLTQEGAVIGTPVYMPPEQAAGKLEQIDERSDIYSMGAILYEILTLQPPISKEGGYWPILLRVSQGQIDPPEQKAPERKVSPDLAAIAMKALAKRKEDRYQTVESLRRDIERFMEGRSVSAKHDTIREMAVKLVKRNKGVSIAVAAAAVILFIGGVWSLIAILSANARTRAEELAKREQAKKSAPSFVRAAKLLINEKQFDDALNQVNTAINYDETEPEARFVRAELLLAQQEYAAARRDLETCLKLRPERSDAKKLLELARDAHRDDKGTLLAFAEEFGRQKAFAFAERMSRVAEELMASNTERLQTYQIRIEAVWPGQGRALRLDGEGKYHIDLAYGVPVNDLEPLRGIPLSSLTVMDAFKVPDLGPLKGMPLVTLNINGSPSTDLTPLIGAPLESLTLTNCVNLADISPLKGMRLKTFNVHNQYGNGKVADLSPLEGMPLTTLNLMNHRNISDISPLRGMALTNLDVYGSQVKDLKPLNGMPLVSLGLGAASSLRDFSPLKGMPLKELRVYGANFNDLSPLAGMKLTMLTLDYCSLPDLAPLKDAPLTSFTMFNSEYGGDLAPLKGMPLRTLDIGVCKTNDLSPLKGMQLVRFAISSPLVKDLEPLKGMPLVELSLLGCTSLSDLSALRDMKLRTLSITQTQVADLEPIRGVPLTQLYLHRTNIAELAPLAGMKLETIGIEETAVSDLAPLVGMPITNIRMNDCPKLHDLTPLAGMKLTTVWLPPHVTKGMDAIRAMKSVQFINGVPAEQFWRLWDAAKSKGK